MDLINRIKMLVLQTKLEIMDRNQINQHISILNGFVDLILVTHEFIVCFKDFWTFNNLEPNIITNYLVGSQQINAGSTNGKKFIFILFTKKDFVVKNNINKNVLLEKNIYILEKNSQDKLLKDLSYLLYSGHIYFYDNDLDTIMLE